MGGGAKHLPQIPNVASDFDDIISDLNKIAGSYQHTQLMTMTIPQEIWQGAAKGGYQAGLEGLKSKTAQLGSTVDRCKMALNDLKVKVEDLRPKITDLQKQWDEAETAYKNKISSLNTGDTVTYS